MVFPGKSFFSAHEVSTCKISGCLSYRILDSGPDGTQTTLTIQLAIVNKLTQVLIGDIYLRQQCDVFWLGYTITPAHARQGYAFEAITATIGWIKENGFSLIKAGVDPENTSSIKLLIRTGFHFSGIEEGEHIYVLDLTKGE
ncbi:GNAT family N-acetyltransferase [Escherichia coli]|uniref:GNAT family N-acetyltransferase n=1 Tax=Escherichia coli TaxID=562 RepID=UPI0028FCC0F4|nr:GNAT family N-acetyltransferase [Escherichia coli]